MSDETRNRGFSPDEVRTLAGVLDEIIPPRDDGRLPGAGALGLARYVDEALENMPELRSMIGDGLAALNDLAARRSSRVFAELSKQDRSEVMNELASTEHAFPPILILHVYAGYYQHARVIEALGIEPRPPHPKGYQMEANDLTLLDPVRRRPKLYREC